MFFRHFWVFCVSCGFCVCSKRICTEHVCWKKTSSKDTSFKKTFLSMGCSSSLFFSFFFWDKRLHIHIVLTKKHYCRENVCQSWNATTLVSCSGTATTFFGSELLVFSKHWSKVLKVWWEKKTFGLLHTKMFARLTKSNCHVRLHPRSVKKTDVPGWWFLCLTTKTITKRIFEIRWKTGAIYSLPNSWSLFWRNWCKAGAGAHRISI